MPVLNIKEDRESDELETLWGIAAARPRALWVDLLKPSREGYRELEEFLKIPAETLAICEKEPPSPSLSDMDYHFLLVWGLPQDKPETEATDTV